MTNTIDFTRVNNDTNGNPRYVCHFLNLLTKEENGFYCEDKKEYIEPIINLNNKYAIALKRAKKIGGRKFHNKQYGGGIVFQSYNIAETERRIKELIKTNK